MSIPTTGAVTFDMVRSEFGGDDPVSLTEYYGIATGVPTSGTISLSHFRGTAKAAAGSVILDVSQDFTCPDGYTSLDVCIIGGGGGGNGGHTNDLYGGASGDISSGTLSVYAGQIIHFYCGEPGQSGEDNNSAGAGGSSSFDSYYVSGGDGGVFQGTGGSRVMCYGTAYDGYDDDGRYGGQAGFSNGGKADRTYEGDSGDRGSGGGCGGKSSRGGYGGYGCIKISWG